MPLKRYESTGVDHRTLLHVPSGTHWSTSSDTHQAVEIQKETSIKMYTMYENGTGFKIIERKSTNLLFGIMTWWWNLDRNCC